MLFDSPPPIGLTPCSAMRKGWLSVDKLLFANPKQRAICKQTEAGLERESQAPIVKNSVDKT